MKNCAPIGIFDSGVGGLSVLREIRDCLPNENLIYVADSGHVPYGNKGQSYIRARSLALTRFLLDQQAKAIVIACNTATAFAADFLRARFSLPIIAMEPAVKPANAATKSGVVGVLATVGTLNNARFAALLERFGKGMKIVVQACPGLVEQVETGNLTGKETRRLVEQFCAPLLAAGADVIVLGCTHYPFLRPLIQQVVGPGIQLIDTGKAVARHLKHVLRINDLSNTNKSSPRESFWTSGKLEESRRVISHLWHDSARIQLLSKEYL